MGDRSNANRSTNDNYAITYRNFRQTSIVRTNSDRPPQIQMSGKSLVFMESLDREHYQELLTEIRQALQVDRVLVYRFKTDGSGAIAAESVTNGFPQALMQLDQTFREHYLGQYGNDRVYGINNIYEAGLSNSQIESLEKFAVKAELVAPMMHNNQLLGLLIAHQCSQPREWQVEDIDLFGQIASRIAIALEYADLQQQRQTQALQVELVKEISQLIRRSHELEDILKTAVSEVRQVLKADRVLFYRFKADWSGVIVAESVAPGFPQALMQQLDDPCFRDYYVEQYQNGRFRAIDDVYNAGLTDCHIKTLEQFAVKANLVAPVKSDNQLLGLLIAHQCSQPREWQIAEIDFFSHIATHVGFALDKAALVENRAAQAKQIQSFAEITQLIRRSLCLEDILNTTVSEVRQALKAQRVLVYRFNSDWSGTVVAEAVLAGLPPALMEQIYDTCFRERYAQLYRQGRVCAINNIYTAGLSACHVNSLERFAVKSNLVAPILKNNKLFGLLIAHHCSAPRDWLKSEIDLFTLIATQVGFALEQAELQAKLEQIGEAISHLTIVAQTDESEKSDRSHEKDRILAEDKDHDATVTFADLLWQQ